ncbi:hypothetical protein DVS28_b0123 (plasmid) [Euzebya pacifica]|uniref:GIY-YIG domain-containing protein n=1 Tax=Euzebya pacifica TaxID=1608957 RepID=A0A346Y5Z6_9ACTN|nr:hypothetical protein [Euzebya pacifica]AXV09893.1 hypothetical protein DVS28_b0123 [Euzebya pacifica]
MAFMPTEEQLAFRDAVEFTKPPPKGMAYIYVVKSEGCGCPIYVGETTTSLRARFTGHVRDKVRRIREYPHQDHHRDVQAVTIHLEAVVASRGRRDVEAAVIARYAADGWHLVNDSRYDPSMVEATLATIRIDGCAVATEDARERWRAHVAEQEAASTALSGYLEGHGVSWDGRPNEAVVFAVWAYQRVHGGLPDAALPLVIRHGHMEYRGRPLSKVLELPEATLQGTLDYFADHEARGWSTHMGTSAAMALGWLGEANGGNVHRYDEAIDRLMREADNGFWQDIQSGDADPDPVPSRSTAMSRDFLRDYMGVGSVTGPTLNTDGFHRQWWACDGLGIGIRTAPTPRVTWWGTVGDDGTEYGSDFLQNVHHPLEVSVLRDDWALHWEKVAELATELRDAAGTRDQARWTAAVRRVCLGVEDDVMWLGWRGGFAVLLACVEFGWGTERWQAARGPAGVIAGLSADHGFTAPVIPRTK